MTGPRLRGSRIPVVSRRRSAAFSEAPAWAGVGEGWRHLHGSFQDLGYSIEWHDFKTERELEWSKSFHPGSVEICLNLAGHAEIRAPERRLELSPATAGFYVQSESGLRGTRASGEQHQFITIELSFTFLEKHLVPGERGLHPCLKNLFNGKQTAEVSDPIRLASDYQQTVMSLRRPPVYAAAQRLWYHAKALELASTLFYQSSAEEELFCQRQKRINHERVQKVMAVLKENMVDPLPLEEIGRRVGCSHFYLSRIFSQETGMTISQSLRELRMERAAQLLKEGKMNVTQVAMEVGYSSPSHFSSAFHEMYGCCPGLYPLATPAQKSAQHRR